MLAKILVCHDLKFFIQEKLKTVGKISELDKLPTATPVLYSTFPTPQSFHWFAVDSADKYLLHVDTVFYHRPGKIAPSFNEQSPVN